MIILSAKLPAAISICIVWHTPFLQPINTTRYMFSFPMVEAFLNPWEKPHFLTCILLLYTLLLWICQYLLINNSDEAWLCTHLLFNFSIRVPELYIMTLKVSLYVCCAFVINKGILIAYSLKSWFFFFTFLMSAFKFCHWSIILLLSIVPRIKSILLW